MQPVSEKCGYVEELGCKEDSLKENRFCLNQNQDNLGLSSYRWIRIKEVSALFKGHH